MNTGDKEQFEPAHLAQWLETTRYYLFADLEGLAAPIENALPQLRQDSHGAQDRFISRARGKLLRLVKRAARQDQNPLQELEHAFYFQASFVSQHPDIPKRLLGWLSQGGDTRIHRRIQRVIGHYESRLCRMIAQAKQQGLIRSDVDPRTAAGLFIGMIQSLALRVNANLLQRERLLREAFEAFAVYLAGMALPSK
jgi:AcrR family transcriptional regulator